MVVLATATCVYMYIAKGCRCRIHIRRRGISHGPMHHNPRCGVKLHPVDLAAARKVDWQRGKRTGKWSIFWKSEMAS
jgi:hypothetical protein